MITLFSHKEMAFCLVRSICRHSNSILFSKPILKVYKVLEKSGGKNLTGDQAKKLSFKLQ